MWHTPAGDRTLRGNEAALVKAAITAVAERIVEKAADPASGWRTGVELFDRLPSADQLAVLERVATYLLIETPETLELTAVYDATIGAVFQQIERQIDEELARQVPQDHLWRHLVVRAYRQRFCPADASDGPFPPPPLDCVDPDRWRSAVDALADQVLWDRDYELEYLIADADPQRARLLKELLAIDEDYFVTPGPPPEEPAELEATIDRLQKLTGADGAPD